MLNSGVSFFAGRDGERLAYRQFGEGRPLILLHGFTGDGTLWFRYGQAEAIAARGHRVIMPDFRGHGRSAKPQNGSAYPADVLTDDAFALLDHLSLEAYDLGGYSLGARIVVRMLARGATPGRAVVGGQGLREVLGIGGGAGAFVRRIVTEAQTFEPGSPEDLALQHFRANNEDPVALLHVLDSIVATPVESLSHIQVPTLIVMGNDDKRAESATQLTEALPNAALTLIPGDHTSAATAPQLTTTIINFLTNPPQTQPQ